MILKSLVKTIENEYVVVNNTIHSYKLNGVSDTDQRLVYLHGKQDILTTLLNSLGYNSTDFANLLLACLKEDN